MSVVLMDQFSFESSNGLNMWDYNWLCGIVCTIYTSIVRKFILKYFVWIKW